jgi:hypothetical protein
MNYAAPTNRVSPDYSWPRYVGAECAALTRCVSEVNSLAFPRLRVGFMVIHE